MGAETGLRFDYRRDGRAAGRLVVASEEGRMVLLDQVNLDSEKKRAEIAEALVGRVEGLDERGVLAELSRLAIAIPPETPRPDSSEVQGEALVFSDPEPWPGDVNGADVLGELAATFERFLMLPEGAATACALWTMHAHAHDAAEVSPLLAITSPEKQCGKTTLLEVGTALVPRPMPASNVTPAVLFRAVEKHRPTLLADELDTFIGRHDELRGLLNSGHRRSLAYVLRTVGDNFEPRCFATWCPKMVALIGKLPDTLADRSIPIRMRRKREGEQVERLRLDRVGELEPIRRRAWTWGQGHLDALRAADPDLPDGLHGRAADNWRPLIAIADLAGGNWPQRARRAAVLLSSDRDDDSDAVLLLGDLQALFTDRKADKLSSAAIVSALAEMEDRPWPEWRHDKPITTRQVARLLKPFGIGPKQIRVGDLTLKGYRREDLGDAFARYLPVFRIERGGCFGDVSDREGGENPRGSADVSDVSDQRGGYIEKTRIGAEEGVS